MTSFAGWNFLSTASSMIGNYGLGIVINHFFGTILNAAQGIANQINGQILVLANNFIKATNPVMGKSAGKKDYALLQETAIESTRVTSILYSIIAIPLFLYTPYILELWLKDVPEWTTIFTRLIIIVNFIEFLFLSTTSAVRSVGRIKEMSKKTFIINFIPLLFSLGLFKMGFEPYYLYITQIFARLLLLINVTVYAKKYCKISFLYYSQKALIPLITFFSSNIFIFSLLLKFIPCNSITLLLINLCMNAIFMLITLIFIINKKEKTIIKELIKDITLKLQK